MKFLKDLKAIFLFSAVIVLFGLNSCDKSAITELDMPEADTTKLTFRGSSERTQLLEEYNRNYNKWKSLSISTYKIVENLDCYCPRSLVTPHEITVVNNVITRIKDERGRSESIANTSFKTIEELFKFIETSLKGDFAGVQLKYNSLYGYPELVFFNFDALKMDEEVGYTISKFSK